MSDPQEPQSRLTRERPDIWVRAVDLAHGLTGYTYARKDPLPNGSIYACGGYLPTPRDRRTTEEIKRDQIADIERRIRYYEDLEESSGDSKQDWIDSLKKERDELLAAPVVYVPEGAMEWLLHEVGHYIAASPAERVMPNYGLLGDGDTHSAIREWQAWAVEEIILAPFGHARDLAPPTQRDGVGYTKSGPIPLWATDHVGRQLQSLRFEVDPWQRLCAEWVQWSTSTYGNHWMDVDGMQC